MGGPCFVLSGCSLRKVLRAFSYSYVAHQVAQTPWPSQVVSTQATKCNSIFYLCYVDAHVCKLYSKGKGSRGCCAFPCATKSNLVWHTTQAQLDLLAVLLLVLHLHTKPPLVQVSLARRLQANPAEPPIPLPGQMPQRGGPLRCPRCVAAQQAWSGREQLTHVSGQAICLLAGPERSRTFHRKVLKCCCASSLQAICCWCCQPLRTCYQLAAAFVYLKYLLVLVAEESSQQRRLSSTDWIRGSSSGWSRLLQADETETCWLLVLAPASVRFIAR